MPPLLESDDVDDIDTGKFVYWCTQDEDIPRDVIGEVIEVIDEKRRVQFPKAWAFVWMCTTEKSLHILAYVRIL